MLATAGDQVSAVVAGPANRFAIGRAGAKTQGGDARAAPVGTRAFDAADGDFERDSGTVARSRRI